jgi:hypothetical protein
LRALVLLKYSLIAALSLLLLLILLAFEELLLVLLALADAFPVTTFSSIISN